MSTPKSKDGRQSYLPTKRKLEETVAHFEDADFAQAMPAVYQLLCHALIDGRYRASARLTLFAEQGRLKASIWDPDTSQVWYATLEGWEDPLGQVEALLEAHRGEWREARKGK